MNQFKRKLISIFSIMLLSISLIIPPQALPVQAASGNEDVDDAALEIEKELEAELEKEEGEKKQTQATVEDDDELSSMLDGIDFDEEATFDEDDFVLNGKVESDIIKQYDEAKTVDVIIRLKEKVDMNELANSTAKMDTKEDKAAHAVQSLKEKAESSQGSVLQALEDMKAESSAANIQSFWVFNGVAATLSQDALEELAARDDVERITLDAEIQAPEFNPTESEPRLPEYGLEKINAPKVWGEYDQQGEGTVVGIMDSGVQGDHEALKDNYRGRDGDAESSWADFSSEEYDVPTDGQGHGTHVAGSAVGGGGGEPIGVAPGAEWIAAKIFNDGGSATTSGIHEAFEWFMAPGGDPDKAPDVVNNSWGNSNTYETEFLEDVKAWLSAGIFPLFAAGNDGPGSETIGAPGSFPETFSIGATDENDQVAPFSSRGPVYWEDEDGEEKRYIKPEVSAPGVDIYSSLPDGGYGFNSGTSMATPHVAGAIALIIASNPDLTDAEIMDLLQDTVRTEEFMGELPNDDYGEGIVDVYQAITESTHAGELKGTLTDEDDNPISGELYFADEDLRIEIEDDGEFDFKIREGEYEVEITSFGYKTKTETIEIVKDEVLEKDWALHSSTRHDVSGSVQFTSGDPATFAYVRVKDTPLDATRTDENGEFSIADLPEGEYTLVISGQGIEPMSETIQVDADLTVDVEVESITIEAEDDWATSRNSYTRNAVTEADVSAENLKLDWSVEEPLEMVFSSPIIAEGKVVYTTNNGSVNVIDEQTGEKDWSIRTGLSNRSTPTVKDGVVYVGGGGDFAFHAISLETGLKKWSTQLDYPAVYETPIVKDGVVYISSYMESGAKALALDAETGDVIWEQAIGDGSFYGPVMGDDTLFVSTYDSRELYALSPEDGEIKWNIQLEEEGFSSSPVYVDGVLYANTNDIDEGKGSLRAFDASSGEELWKAEDIGNSEAGSPIVYDNLVLTGSKVNPVIKAFDKTSGELVWETENGSPMSNSGAVSGNGHLFLTDASSNLKVYDVFTGERIASYSLDQDSTNGIAISDGQVIVTDKGKVYRFAAPGELSGTVTDSDDNPLDAKVSIRETDESAETDGDGHYSLEGNPGTYEVKVASYGYKQVVEDIEFVSGYEREKSYQLEKADVGSLSGQVVDAQTDEPLEGATIEIKETGLESTTDSEGTFTFEEVYEGTYDVTLSLGGYAEETVEVEVEAGENTDEKVELQNVDVAVLNDLEDGDIVSFLNDNDFVAEERDWDIIDEISGYEVVVLNGAYTSGGDKPTEEQINGIINAANEADVSLLFAGTWGPSYGSLEYLAKHTGDPAKYDAETQNSGDVHMRVDSEHPIFDGLEEESTHLAIDRPYLSWFNQYSGRTIGSIGTGDRGFVGSGVAYKAVNEDSAHLLMSSHAASLWVSPYMGWTSTQQEVYLNGIDYLLNDAEFGELSGTVQDSDGEPVEDVTVTVEDTGVTVETDENGEYELFHDEGEYEVSFRKSGYSTEKTEVEFTHGEPSQENLVLADSGSGTISGHVIDTVTKQEVPYAEVTVYDDDGEEVVTEVGSKNGDYEITGLEEATYTLEIKERDYVVYEETVEMTGESVALDIELYPEPSLGIIGDESIGSLSDALLEKGIEAENYSGMEDAMEELEDLDVIFFNSESLTSAKKKVLEKFIDETDEHEVSVIYGDEYYSGSGLNHLVDSLGDPEERERIRDKDSSAGYVITEENPIFGDAEEGDFVPILTPGGSSISAFENYSGYPLADIKHQGNNDVHGEGVAYKPRTAGSMEILMGGHGISTSHRSDAYTEEGMDMFVNAILHAAYIEYNAIEGTVTDDDGNPLDATVELVGQGMEKDTDPETGEFSLGSIDGEFELEVNSFGYATYTTSVTVDDDIQPLNIEMTPADDVGAIEGMIVDEETGQGIEDADVNLIGHPREALTDVSGSFVLNTLEPGDYSVHIERDGYVDLDVDVSVEAGETTTIEKEMKPTPTIGVIVDSQSSSAFSLDEYLTDKGYEVEEFYYTDLENISDVDLVFANSDYDNSLIPEEDVFRDFLKELDKTETPVIWTGNNGPRGSIRFLEDYIGDPEVEHVGRLSSEKELTATVTKDHPILDGVELDENDQFTFPTGYYAGFEGYTGETIADVTSEETGDIGALIGYGGRTLNSNEVLLETMTFGYGFSEDDYFDENREKIVNNAINWALEDHDPLVGEIHGQVTNDLEGDVFATVTVEETGYTFDTEQDGSFFLGLDDGTYTLDMSAFGHEDERFEVTVERGEVLDETFAMTSDNAGTIEGTITSKSDGEPIEDAVVQLLDTPLEVTSEDDGSYQVQAPAGDYQIRITAEGYAPKTVDVEIEAGETATIDIALEGSEQIAFVGKSTNEKRVMPFLEEQGYAVDFVDADDLDELTDELADYALVIWNDNSASEEEFKDFVDNADEEAVSIIFASQFNSGTIRDLNNFYGDPAGEASSFAPEYIDYTVLENHPIFNGFEKGDTIKVVDRGESNQQYHAFEDYSGTTIADLENYDEGRLGSAVAYDYPTANNVHILLDSLQVGLYGSPEDRWTDDAKRIYVNAIDWALAASLGEISGTVKDTDGDAIDGANVSIDSEDIKTKTDKDGAYSLGVGLGEYVVEAKASGYESVSETVKIEDLNETFNLDFELVATDRATLSGKVSDDEDAGIEDVSLTLSAESDDFEGTETTDEDGNYEFKDLVAGDYQLVVEAKGYKTIEKYVTLDEGEERVEDFHLGEFNIAVLGDHKGNLSDFLNDNDVPAQARDWDVIDDVYNYKTIIVNSSEGTEEQLETLIEEADDYETSLIFVDTWGPDGSIQLLEDVLGNPTRSAQGYDEGAVYIQPSEEHEIFDGLDEEEINVHSEKSPYATFKDYDGLTLASLTVDGEDKGATIAYDFHGENHMHMLLSSYAVNNMTGPDKGWTDDGQRLFLQAVEWAKDGEQELPDTPEWKTEGPIITNEDSLKVEGEAEYTSNVEILDGDKVLAEAKPDRDGTFETELTDLDDDHYDLVLRASNYKGDSDAKETLDVIVDTTAPELEVVKPEDELVTNDEVIDVEGTVTDDNLEKVLVNDNEVAVEDDAFQTQLSLDKGTHEIVITASDIAGNETEVKRTVTIEDKEALVIEELKPDSDKYVTPGDEVDISFKSNAEGGTAIYRILLPAQNTTQSSGDDNMEEVEPGVYNGTWKVPAGVELQGAVIEVELTDEEGDSVKQEAEGNLYISPDSIDRIAGDIRYDTAIETSKKGWAKADTVILARGKEYADALSGVPLAYKLDAPILLTPTEELWEATLDEINRLNASNVIILGGPDAVDESVQEQLENNGLDVERIAGNDRFETAEKIAMEVAPDGAEKVVLANGMDFPDALSAATHAAQQGMPVLLSKADWIPESTEGVIADLSAKQTIVVGGKEVIQDKILANLPDSTRLAGDDRYETNVAVNEYFGADDPHMYVATGQEYADALTGAVLAAKNDSTILLVHRKVPASVETFLNEHDVKRLSVFGGDVAVSDEVLKQLQDLLK